jgi:hypothetical protein
MKHTARAAVTFAILTLAFLTGCAGNPLRPVDTSALEQEIQKLRAQVVELQREAAMNEVEMARLRQQAGIKAPAPAPAPARTEPSRIATATPPRPQPPVQTPRVTTPPVTQSPTQPTTQPARPESARSALRHPHRRGRDRGG